MIDIDEPTNTVSLLGKVIANGIQNGVTLPLMHQPGVLASVELL